MSPYIVNGIIANIPSVTYVIAKKTPSLEINNSVEVIGIYNTHSNSLEKNKTLVEIRIIWNISKIVKSIKYIFKKIWGCPTETNKFIIL